MSVSFAPFTSVAVFGGLAVDRIATTAAAPTLGASNPGRVHTAPGGVGFNVALALARLELGVRFVGVVGDDTDGATMLTALQAAEIDAGATIIDPRRPTATYHAVFDDRGGLVVGVADTGIYDALTPSALAAAARAAQADQLWVVDANFPPETLAFLFDAARDRGRPVAALPISPAKAMRFAGIDRRPRILFANRREAAAMAGLSPNDAIHPQQLVEDLARIGFAHAIVTDSSAPLAVVSDGVSRSYLPPEIHVTSVNGAGDALAAGTLYGLSLGMRLFDAVPCGLAAAALTVESSETVRGDLKPALLTARIAEHVA